jgi:hypothetical protein
LASILDGPKRSASINDPISSAIAELTGIVLLWGTMIFWTMTSEEK